MLYVSFPHFSFCTCNDIYLTRYTQQALKNRPPTYCLLSLCQQLGGRADLCGRIDAWRHQHDRSKMTYPIKTDDLRNFSLSSILLEYT